MHIVFFSGSAIFFLVLMYPYVFYPIILRFLPREIDAESMDLSPPQLSVALLFCAHNEEQSLPAKIENIREIKEKWPAIEVRAYADCCTDGTVELLRGASDILILHESLIRTGKAAGMRELVAATDVDILVFTDANVILENDAISRILTYFANPAIGTVAGTLHYTNPNDSMAAFTGSLYWRLEESIKRLESKTGSTMGADGSIFAMRRSLYPEVPDSLLDDLIASINPVFKGYRVISAPDVHAYEKSTIDSFDEFRRKRRIACRAFNTHRYLAPQLNNMSILNRFKYVSHKYLRWFSAGTLLLSIILAMCAVATLKGFDVAVIILLIGVVTLAIGHKLSLPILDGMAEVILSIIAVGIGVAEALVGRNYRIWNPAKSRQ